MLSSTLRDLDEVRSNRRKNVTVVIAQFRYVGFRYRSRCMLVTLEAIQRKKGGPSHICQAGRSKTKRERAVWITVLGGALCTKPGINYSSLFLSFGSGRPPALRWVELITFQAITKLLFRRVCDATTTLYPWAFKTDMCACSKLQPFQLTRGRETLSNNFYHTTISRHEEKNIRKSCSVGFPRSSGRPFFLSMSFPKGCIIGVSPPVLLPFHYFHSTMLLSIPSTGLC